MWGRWRSGVRGWGTTHPLGPLLPGGCKAQKTIPPMRKGPVAPWWGWSPCPESQANEGGIACGGPWSSWEASLFQQVDGGKAPCLSLREEGAGNR